MTRGFTDGEDLTPARAQRFRHLKVPPDLPAQCCRIHEPSPGTRSEANPGVGSRRWSQTTLSEEGRPGSPAKRGDPEASSQEPSWRGLEDVEKSSVAFEVTPGGVGEAGKYRGVTGGRGLSCSHRGSLLVCKGGASPCDLAAHGGDGQAVAGLGSSVGSWPSPPWLPGAAGGLHQGPGDIRRMFWNECHRVRGENSYGGATRGQGGCREQSPGQRRRVGGVGSGLPKGGGNGATGRATAGTQRVWAASGRSGTDPRVSNWVAGEKGS